MRDELNKNRVATKNESLVLNTDISKNNGTHWCSLFIQDGVSYYFDSYGFSPPLEVIEYCKGNRRYYNSFKLQEGDQVICGQYCIYMLYRLSNGDEFSDVLDELYRYKI